MLSRPCRYIYKPHGCHTCTSLHGHECLYCHSNSHLSSHCSIIISTSLWRLSHRRGTLFGRLDLFLDLCLVALFALVVLMIRGNVSDAKSGALKDLLVLGVNDDDKAKVETIANANLSNTTMPGCLRAGIWDLPRRNLVSPILQALTW